MLRNRAKYWNLIIISRMQLVLPYKNYEYYTSIGALFTQKDLEKSYDCICWWLQVVCFIKNDNIFLLKYFYKTHPRVRWMCTRRCGLRRTRRKRLEEKYIYVFQIF